MASTNTSSYQVSKKLKQSSIMMHLLVSEWRSFIKHTLLRKTRLPPSQQLENTLDDASRKTFEDALLPLETLRQQINKDAWVLRKVALPLLLVYMVACLLIFPVGKLLSFWVLALPLTLLCLPAGVIKETFFDAYEHYNDQFRRAFIPALAKSFGDIEYQQNGYIAEERFKSRLPLGATSFDLGLAIARTEQEDYFRGTHRGCQWELVQATFYNYKHKSTFKGLLLLLELPRSFEGTTVINMRNPVSGAQRVHLEKGEFSDHLIVSSTDQISARSWLTPAVMERLYQLRTLFDGLKGHLAGSRLLLMMDTPNFLSLPPIDIPLIESKPCLHFVSELETLYQLIDTLLAQFPDLPPQTLRQV